MRRLRPALVLALVPLLPGLGRDASAQSLPELVSACAAQAPGLRGWCQGAALTFQAAQAGLGLSAAGGSELPGSASTLGRRLRTQPRLALTGRTSLLRMPLPDLEAGGGLPGGGRSVLVPGAHLYASLGLLNGFSLAPTVGGVLSLDLTGSAHLLAPPRGSGLPGGRHGWGGGARLGILRESFTLPGLSLSLAHRRVGSWTAGDFPGGDPVEARFDVGVSSVRAVAGKDIMGVGLLAGTGWDRYSGEAFIRARDAVAGSLGEASASGISSRRRLFFAGGSLTFLILQLSAEAGWARGFGPESGGEEREVAFDPGERSYFGSLALRLTF